MAADLNSYAHTLGFQDHQEQQQAIILAITMLEGITNRILTEEQAKIWKVKLMKFPRWKLIELSDYSGPMNHKVFEYLSQLQPKPVDAYADLGYDKDRKQLPESVTKENIKFEIARDFSNHVQKYCGPIGGWNKKEETEDEIKARLQAQLDSYRVLDVKYPWLNIMAQVKDEKRYGGLE